MLNPDSRIMYAEALRPPEGYTLDKAVATTFSLDLTTVLIVPLSLAAFECSSFENPDPLIIIEALRRTAQKVTVFCQEGQIKVPASDTPLYSQLESTVVEVNSPNAGGVFHPKTWLLRFVSEGQPVLYRFLCLSRNLTFDRSWDTILTLDGYVGNRRFARNRPLADFLKALPSLAKRPSEELAAGISNLADELMRVNFEPPDGFNDFSFRPIGIPGYRRFSIPSPYNRLLVVSPFLKSGVLERLLAECSGRVLLISRQESLDELPEKLKERFSAVYILDDAADIKTIAGDVDAAKDSDSDPPLSGLHAKLFVAETGLEARVWTGSANATNSAFNNRNVEFMVQLNGKRKDAGIDRFLGSEEDKECFRNMLLPYRNGSVSDPNAELISKMEALLDAAKEELSGLDLTLEAFPAGEQVYDLCLSAGRPFTKDSVSIRCWPVTLKPAQALTIDALGPGSKLVFHRLSPVSLTGFMAFELSTASGGLTRSTRFVFNLPFTGGPADRAELVLHHVISDTDRFIRYILLLLYDGETSSTDIASLTRSHSNGESRFVQSPWQQPVLEEMVRAYSRNPEKLKRIHKLVDDLRRPGGRNVIPDGFDDIWNAFTEGLKNEQR